MSLGQISFIIQCCSCGFAFLVFVYWFLNHIKVKRQARKALKAIENEKKEQELFLRLKKKYERE